MHSDSQGMDRKGLLLTGSVVGRSKRFVGSDNTEVVTYRINDGFTTYNVTHWKPESYFPLGQHVCLPVYVKASVRNNRVFVSYVIKQDKQVEGEF